MQATKYTVSDIEGLLLILNIVIFYIYWMPYYYIDPIALQIDIWTNYNIL